MPASMTSPSNSISGNEPLNANPPVLVLDALGQQFQYIDIKKTPQPNGGYKKTPYHQSYTPNYNDFVFKPESIVERMDAKNKRPYVGLDTCLIGQIDIDIVDGVDEGALKWLYENCCYFLSVSKRLPHFLVQFDEQPWCEGVHEKTGEPKLKGTVSKVKIGSETAADFLHGQWTYMKTDEVLQNAHLLDQIPTINLKEWKAKLTKKFMAIENMCLPLDAAQVIQPPVCIPLNEKKIHSKAPDITKLIAALKKVHVDADEGRTFKSMAWALKSHSGDAHKDELREAGRLSTYCQNDYESWFERLWQFDTDGEAPKPISIGSFYYHCKELLGKEYFTIRSEYMPARYGNTPLRIACDFEMLLGDDWRFHNEQRYMFDEFMWKEDTKKGNRFQSSIIKHMHPLYSRLAAVSSSKMAQLTADDAAGNEIEKVKSVCAGYGDLMGMCIDVKKIQEIGQLFNGRLGETTDEDMKWDQNFDTFYFKNCVFDLRTGLPTKPDREHYVTISTGYDYVKPTEAQLNKIECLFEKVLPIEDERKLYLLVLASALTGRQLDRFTVGNGSGGNGKSALHSLMKATCGNYAYELNRSALTKDQPSEKNDDLANLNKKRFVVVAEPEEKTAFKIGMIKNITGNATINSRKCYSSDTKVDITATLVCECNQKPKLEGRMDEAVARRILDVPFRSSFVDKSKVADYHGDYVFEKDMSFIGPEFAEEHRCALFHYLLPYVQKLYAAKFNIGDFIPESIRERNREYMQDSDDFKTWLDEQYEKKGDGFIQAKEMFNMYKMTQHPRMSKKQQLAQGYKWFVNELQSNMFVKADFKAWHRWYDENKCRKESREVLMGWRMRRDEPKEEVEDE